MFSFLAQDNFGIIKPFPENIYPIEGTSAEVTCVAFDSSGVKTPERIQFMRKDQYARYTNITATDNIKFTSRIEEVEDQGSYMCIVLRNEYKMTTFKDRFKESLNFFTSRVVMALVRHCTKPISQKDKNLITSLILGAFLLFYTIVKMIINLQN